MICGICEKEESKYKCPKCSIAYCSLSCYKSPNHKHPEKEEEVKKDEPPKVTIPDTSITDDKYGNILQDKQIQYYLSQPTLQFHLSTIIQILNDPTFTPKGSNPEQKLDIANLKLSDLRSGGIEQNELVEEFIQHVLYLMNT